MWTSVSEEMGSCHRAELDGVSRLTADNLNQEEQIVLNKSALLSCELDDLLK